MLHFEFYTRPTDEGKVAVVVVVGDVERFVIETPDRDTALALIKDMVSVALEEFGGFQTYYNEQRN
jgi:hypothetical protein